MFNDLPFLSPLVLLELAGGHKRANRMPASERRYSKRTPRKQTASLVLDMKWRRERQPCLVLDSCKNGFRVRGSFHLKRGQTVEVILDEDPLSAVRCSVAWVGRTGSKQEGEAGLEII